MHGQQKLVELRLRGHAPSMVWIDMDPHNIIDQAKDWFDFEKSTAHVQFDVGDKVSRLDLRFVRGLSCFVEGPTKTGVHELRDKCIELGATRVIASVMERHGSGDFVSYQCTDMTDTKGVFTTPTPEAVHG